jgi:hypothetical protein
LNEVEAAARLALKVCFQPRSQRPERAHGVLPSCVRPRATSGHACTATAGPPISTAKKSAQLFRMGAI